MELQGFTESVRLLRTRRFGTFFVASLLSDIGTWAQQVAQPWLLLSLGASPFLVGLDAFVQGAPVWMLTILGGVLADRGDRRRVIVGFQSVQMLCPVLLVVLLITGVIQPWMVIVTSLVVGVTDALSMPSFQSIVPSIVARDQIATGLALNATQFNLSRILGPALAGGLLLTVGAAGCFAINAASYVPFLLVAMWVLPRRVARATSPAPFEGAHLFDGIRQSLRQPQLRGALATVFFTSLLCGPLITFSPVLVRDAFHGDATHFSAAVGAFGLGGLVGAVALLFVDSTTERRLLSCVYAVGYGLVVVLAAWDPWLLMLPVILVLAGICMSVSNTSANTLVQTSAPSELRGQTVSLYMLAIRGGTSLGSLLTGASASTFGVRHALLVNGALAIVAHFVVIWWWRRQRSVVPTEPSTRVMAPESSWRE